MIYLGSLNNNSGIGWSETESNLFDFRIVSISIEEVLTENLISHD